jgi:hypothetical protein
VHAAIARRQQDAVTNMNANAGSVPDSAGFNGRGSMMVPRRTGAWEHAHMNRFNPALLAAGLTMCLAAGAASAQSSGYGGYNGGYASHWILLSHDPSVLQIPAIRERSGDLTGYSTDIILWTDTYSNLFLIMK